MSPSRHSKVASLLAALALSFSLIGTSALPALASEPGEVEGTGAADTTVPSDQENSTTDSSDGQPTPSDDEGASDENGTDSADEGDSANEGTTGTDPSDLTGDELADDQGSEGEQESESEGETTISELDAKAADKATAPTLTARAHVQNLGWQDGSTNAGITTVGTTGRALRLEALTLSTKLGEGQGGGIKYLAHVQNVGTQGWQQNGATSGTIGRSLRIEAVKIELTGQLASDFDVWYRVHAQNYGWMGWTRNGAFAGTLGRSLRLESLQITILPKNSSTPSATGQTTSASFLDNPQINVRAHSQNVGWMGTVHSKATAGTTGRGLRLEAFTMSVSGSRYSGGIEYQAHVQNVGQQGAKANGATAGTTGRGLRIEAIRARLTGDLAKHYDLYYRVHMSNAGWLPWTTGNAWTGSSGLCMRIEAIQVAFVSKGSPSPSNSGMGFTTAYVTATPRILYQGAVSGQWQAERSSGTAGTTGQQRALNDFSARLDAAKALTGGVSYRTHLSKRGWTGWKSSGGTTSTLSAGTTVEAFQLKLTGEASKIFDVWYRAHVANYGWLGWARNGETAGTTELGNRLEGLQVVIRSKGQGAPGSTANHALDSGSFDPMTRRARTQFSSTGYLVMVSLSDHRVGVYTGSNGNWRRTQYFVCSVGAPSSPTVRGTFKVGSRGYAFGHGYTCYYWTQFYNDYLFHSVKYYEGTFNVMDGRLGQSVSLGCVRLQIDQAKWIYDHIPTNSTVVVY